MYKLGPVPQELIAWAKGTMVEHLKTTQDWRDLKDVNDLISRATENVGMGEEGKMIESESTYLKIADCVDFVEVVKKRRDEFEKMGEQAERELKRFDGLRKLVNQPRRV